MFTGFYDNREICNGYMPKHLCVKKISEASEAYIAFKTIPLISLFDLPETLPETDFERHQYCNHIMTLFAQLPVFPA